MIIKDLDDYLDDICQKYPKVPRHEIKRLLEYGFNTFYTLNKRGADVVIYNRSFARSEERRVGKECRSRWSPYH